MEIIALDDSLISHHRHLSSALPVENSDAGA